MENMSRSVTSSLFSAHVQLHASLSEHAHSFLLHNIFIVFVTELFWSECDVFGQQESAQFICNPHIYVGFST